MTKKIPKTKRAAEGAFGAAYSKLNDAQKEAVDTIDGPVLVIAGPGTGKTQILTLRIANILRRTDTAPSSILALTFTESAAHGLKRRLVEIVGSEGYRVRVFTFHGFAADIIDRFPDYVPRIIGARPIHAAEKIVLIRKILKDGEFPILKPLGSMYHYVNSIMSSISELKRAALTPDEFARRTEASRAAADTDRAQKVLDKALELSRVYALYEAGLRERHKYDFEDMIIEALRAMNEHPDLVASLQEEFQYILADEHQDANEAQNQILTLLAGTVHETPNIFIVGDDKQAIYRFQGASLDHFTGFSARYPSAKIIDLTHNYRSHQGILDASHSVIDHNPAPAGRMRPRLHAASDPRRVPLQIAELPDPKMEIYFVAERVKRSIEEGVLPQDIAILTRTNSDAEDIAEALQKSGVPHLFDSNRALLKFSSVRYLITLIRAVVNFGGDDTLIPAVLLPFSGVDSVDLYHALRVARKNRVEIIAVATTPKLAKQIGTSGKKLASWVRKLNHFRQRASVEDALTLIDDLARELGLVGHILTADSSLEELEALRAFIDDLRELAPTARLLPELAEFIQIIDEYGAGARMLGMTPKEGRVRIMTAHRAKGLEFEHVYVVRANDTVWGNRKSREDISLSYLFNDMSIGDTEEERRLFYVALTRAKQELVITYAQESWSGAAALPSQFVEEIEMGLVESIAVQGFMEKFDPVIVFQSRVSGPSVTDRAVLQELFTDQGLSVSAINNYLKSPWLYFFRNLIRVPEMQSGSMLYGTAIHAALRRLHERVESSGECDAQFAVATFAHELHQLPVSSAQLGQLTEKGSSALTNYIAKYRDEFFLRSKVEMKIELQIPLSAEPHHLRLRGDIDKLVERPDGTRVVYDYKTGKPKSRNEIEGKTKSLGSGDMIRQLTFYKLLLQEYAGGAFASSIGIIDFIEPNERGIIKREEFYISDDDVTQLRSEVSRIANEIYSLAFWDHPCDKDVVGDSISNLHALLLSKKSLDN